MWSVVDEETGRHPNQTQFGPHFDKDFVYHQEECDKLLEVLRPVMVFVQDGVSTCVNQTWWPALNVDLQLRAKIPTSVFEKLEIVAESLPLNAVFFRKRSRTDDEQYVRTSVGSSSSLRPARFANFSKSIRNVSNCLPLNRGAYFDPRSGIGTTVIVDILAASSCCCACCNAAMFRSV